MAAPRPLTPRQREIYDLIVDQIRTTGSSPTLRELKDRVGIKSTNGVNDNLVALEKKGWITRSSMTARGIQPVGSRCPTCGGLGVLLHVPRPAESLAPVQPLELPVVPDLVVPMAAGGR